MLEIKNINDLSELPTANAFRVYDDGDGDGMSCFLDFLSYDPNKNKASVVSRVLVSRGFLKAIRDRLNLSLEEIVDEKPEKK